ncbi:hypothetical protein SRHO_G00141810 [Serrasalmus rhombeus]
MQGGREGEKPNQGRREREPEGSGGWRPGLPLYRAARQVLKGREAMSHRLRHRGVILLWPEDSLHTVIFVRVLKRHTAAAMLLLPIGAILGEVHQPHSGGAGCRFPSMGVGIGEVAPPTCCSLNESRESRRMERSHRAAQKRSVRCYRYKRGAMAYRKEKEERSPL